MPYLRPPNKKQQSGAEEQPVTGGLLSGYTAQATPANAGQTMPGLAAQASPPSLYGMGGSGPSVTGHVNFDRIYAANEGTAQRDASRFAGQADRAAKGARNQLANMQTQFASQSKTGIGSGPTAAQRAWASYGSTGVQQPAAVGNPPKNDVTDLKGGIVIPPTQPPPRPPPGGYVAGQDAANQAAVEAGAHGEYTGPNSLRDIEGYSDLLKNYGKAEHGLSNLQDNAHLQAAYDEQNQGPNIEGGSMLDAALTGQAGRERFAGLLNNYRGMGNEVGKATQDSMKQADAARSAVGDNNKAYQGLLDQYSGRKTADQAKADQVTKQNQAYLDSLHRQEDDIHDSQTFNQGSYVTSNGPNGPEKTWASDDYVKDAIRTFGGNETLEDARDPHKMFTAWQTHFAISQSDTDRILAHMTQSDWDDYQKAVRRGPDAIRKFLRDQLAKAKGS